MKKVLIILLSSLLTFALQAKDNGNDNGNNHGNGDVPTRHNEATIAQLQADMASGKLTSKELTQEYIARILALDQNGPGQNADQRRLIRACRSAGRARFYGRREFAGGRRHYSG